MEYVRFKIGEKKIISIRVQSCNKKEFEVTNAKYILKKGVEIEESGSCTIDREKEYSTMLSAIIQPKAKNADYTLEFTYEVPPEILKHEIKVTVT